ncbi:uncharacterized protein LOC132759166 [Ruditapes philippinarum]|uniref:uncharacterized protein LOC132759166 n=1 Tax=Ruditapes philippinarum TaxID=129788 RepID=UPI00295AD44A|nr:uncharacterized protein LOC132759166 [Ruditapes philippinarum]
METLFFQLVIIYLVRSSAFIPAENESYLITIKNVDFHGRGKFPSRIEVVFSFQDNDVSLLLQKDDVSTQLLSEDLFHTSKILPSGLFKDKERDNFAAYESGNLDVLVVHRETSDFSPKFYGRFTHNSNRMVIHAEGGSHKSHRVKRELNEDKDHHRTGRATTDDIIELFIFADLSVYEHIATELLPGKTETEVKTFIKNYLTALGKEVDTIYQYLGKYGDIGTIRVYFQQYQIITVRLTASLI